MTMITGSEIYWITRLDYIKDMVLNLNQGGSGAFLAITLLVSTFAFVIVRIIINVNEVESGEYKGVIKFSTPTLIMFILSSLFFLSASIVSNLSVFIPTSKEMAMIKVVPAIANNEDIQEECKELYTLAKEGLKDLIVEDKK